MFAFRYALGRISMAPSIMCDVISKNKKEISNNIIKNIIYEIDTADRNKCIGDDVDRRDWLNLKKELEEMTKIWIYQKIIIKL